MLKQKLKEVRLRAGLSQGKLAKLLVEKGVLKTCTDKYISALENKQFTNFDLFQSICEVLNVRAEVFLHYA